MFGYIKPFKPELKMREFDVYQSIYCGLCKQLGKTYGPFARLTLSYDFTFLAMVALGIHEKSISFKKERCPANPLKRKACVCVCADMSFTAATAMVMAYYKVIDNIADSKLFGKIKAVLALPFVSFFRRKARKLYPDIEKTVSSAMQAQSDVESQASPSLDAAADPTAKALGDICSLIGHDETEQRVLNRFGYLVGRWVYLVDALDDLEKDLKTGNFNPYLLRAGIETPNEEDLNGIKAKAVETINLTAGQLTSTYELIDLQKFKAIIDNIIYLGLKNTVQLILNKDKKGVNE